MRDAGAVTASGAYCRCAMGWVRRTRWHARSWRRNGVRRLLSLRKGSGSGGFGGLREAGAVTASGAYCRCAKVLDLADSAGCAKLAP